MSEKKTAMLGPLRLTEEMASGYKEVLFSLGMDRSTLSKLVLEALIYHHRRGDKFVLPLRFVVAKADETN